MTEKTKRVLNLVLDLMKIIAGILVFVLVLVSYNKIDNLEIKEGYYDTEFVETLVDDVEIFTEYLIDYMKLNGNDDGFEEWLIENDKPLYDRLLKIENAFSK